MVEFDKLACLAQSMAEAQRYEPVKVLIYSINRGYKKTCKEEKKGSIYVAAHEE